VHGQLADRLMPDLVSSSNSRVSRLLTREGIVPSLFLLQEAGRCMRRFARRCGMRIFPRDQWMYIIDNDVLIA
jgi:hypothetical protein